MLPAYFVILLYMALMTREFFVPQWLKSHPVVYLWSHMLVMPLFDFYTTGLDWINNRQPARTGCFFFNRDFFKWSSDRDRKEDPEQRHGRDWSGNLLVFMGRAPGYRNLAGDPGHYFFRGCLGKFYGWFWGSWVLVFIPLFDRLLLAGRQFFKKTGSSECSKDRIRRRDLGGRNVLDFGGSSDAG